MTQEEKQILLRDLCTRLPYDVKGRVYAETTNGEYDINGDMIFFDSPFDVTLDDINTSTEELHVIAIGSEDTVDFIEDQQINGKPYTIDEFKPYLRPMGSMTDEELMELGQLKYQDDKNWEIVEMRVVKHDFVIIKCRNKHNEDYWVFQVSKTEPLRSWQGIDWLLEHHFDYRGLIDKGLAIEAPEGMYKNE